MTLFKRKQKMCVLAVSCLAITILSSCGDVQDAVPDPKTLDLFETFFRYTFKNNGSGEKQNAEAYFLEIDGENPSPEFLARFKGHSPPVKKGSEFVMGAVSRLKERLQRRAMVFYSELIVINGLVCSEIVLKFLADTPKAILAHLGLHTFGSEEKESGNWNLLVTEQSHRTVCDNYLLALSTNIF